MKIDNLSNVARTDELLKNYAKIEEFLGREIESTRTMKVGKEDARDIIAPDTNKELFIRYFRPFSAFSRLESFNYNTGIMIVTGRDKWKRNLSKKMYQFERVGYKVRTTHMPEGWIWGNPEEVNF